MTVQLNIHPGALEVLNRLEGAGFEAWFVGGSVRDFLLGIQPRHYHIATLARPRQIRVLFKRCIETGVDTVTVVEDKIGYELKSYSVNDSGIASIENELREREFTINAMAYHPVRGLLDLYDGGSDLRRGLIRCVGDPVQQLRADPLRMVRAIRFQAVLGFSIEEETARAVMRSAVMIKSTSRTSLLDEMTKILLSAHPYEFVQLHSLGLLPYLIPQLEVCFSTPQRNKYHIYNVGEHILRAVENTPPDPVLRWSALLHDIGKPCCSSTDTNGIIHFYGHHRESGRIARGVLAKYGFEEEIARDILTLIEYHDVRIEPSPHAVKNMLSKIGAGLFEKLLRLQEADNRAKNPKHLEDKLRQIETVWNVYQTILAEGHPYRMSDLAVSPRDLVKLKYHSERQINDTLRLLLDEVMTDPALNNREYLLKRARELKR